MKPSAWILNTSVPSFVVGVVAVVSILVAGDPLTISECEPSGRRNISGDGNAHSTFTCNGFRANETAQWTLRLDGSLSFSVICGQSCDNINSNVNVSRPMASSSTFTIARSFWENNEYAIIVCSSFENASNLYTCYTNVIPPPTSTTMQAHLPITSGSSLFSTVTTDGHTQVTTDDHTQVSPLLSTATTDDHKQGNLEMAPAKDPFPSAAVGGGVAAVVVVVVIVVVVAVVFYKRRSQESGKTRKLTADTGDYDNSAVTDAATIEASARGPYASLEMSEVGLRSVYSDLTHSSNASQSAHPGDYASLQMSDVGMKSTYSVLGQHVGVAKANDGTDYEIPP